MTGILLRAVTAVFAAVLAMLSPDEASAQRRVALVIGNSAYQNVAPLANTRNDANSIAELFRKANFDVVDARQDLGVVEFKRALREFMTIARGAETAVMYFAGHGIEVSGTNYLIPVDAKLATDYDAEDEAVSLDRIIFALEPAQRLRLVILDACRDNPFGRKMQRTVAVRAVNTGLGKVEIMSTDTLVAYAAKAGSVSYDGFGAHSPFTTALLKHIVEPGLDIRIALGRVRDEVLKITGSKQEPFVYGSLGGTTIALVPGAESKKASAPAVPTEQEVRRAYEAAAQIGTKEAWQSFIDEYRAGFYVELGRLQLEKLNAASASETNAAREAKSRAEQEAKARAEQEAKARAEQEVKARAEQEAKARAEQEAKARAAQEAKARAEQGAKARAEQEAKARADQEAKARAEQEAKARADQEAKARAEQEAKARAEQEAKARAEQEAKARAEQESKARAAQEAKARAEHEAKAQAEQEAKARAAQEAKARAEQEARARAERERAERLAAQQRREEERQAKAAEAERLKAREREAKARAEQERAQRFALLQRQEEERQAKEEAERLRAQREAALRPQEKAEPDSEQSCAGEEKRLARLRANPVREEVTRFARELRCAALRPQVNRLLESVGGDAAALAPAPVPARPAPVEEAPQPAPMPSERRESKTGAGREAGQNACQRDEERLAQLRANPVREEVSRFARELTCDDLRPQVQRLLESVGG
jgi:uncharacterized caspase-like protein